MSAEDPRDERSPATDAAEAETESIAEEGPPPTVLGWFLELLRTWGPAVLAVIVIRLFVFQPFSIPSTSMVPTLLIGDYVFVTMFSYGLWLPSLDLWSYDRYELVDWADPSRGDVIVFRNPGQPSVHFIKRVVAVPGDTIAVQDNQILLNGVRQERTDIGRYQYMDKACTAPRTANLWREDLRGQPHAKLTDDRPAFHAMASPRTVPPGKVFVMGDNRDHSGDSREWGFVDEELIMGKAHYIWVSFDHCSDWFPLDLRWDRMFTSLYGEVTPNVADEGASTEPE